MQARNSAITDGYMDFGFFINILPKNYEHACTLLIAADY